MKRARLSLGLCLAAALPSLFGCGAHSATAHEPGIKELREAAAAHPTDARAAREVALAEIFAQGGDPKRAPDALVHARKLDPASPALRFAEALEHDVHGEPRVALDQYLDALDASLTNHDDGHFALTEAIIYAVAGLDGNVTGYAAKLEPRLRALLARADLPLAVRAALVDVLLPLAQRAGDSAEAAQLAAAVGCISELRVAGPFGPRELLGFDASPTLVDPQKPLADHYDLGPARGVRDTRTVHARGCAVHLGAGPIADAGTTFAQTRVTTPKTAEYVVRVDTPNSVELFVDGRSISRIDRRRALGSRVVFVKTQLTAGAHVLTLMVAARHPNPVLALSLLPAVAGDDEASALPFGKTAPRDGFPLYVRGMIALLRGDMLATRNMLATAGEAKDAAALMLLQRAGVALGDPLLPDDVKHDDARRYLAQAFARDSALWAPATQLATLAAKSGRVKESIAALRDAEKRWPEAPAIGFALIDLLRSKSFDADVEREIARLRELIPDACGPLAAQLDMERSRQRARDAERTAQALVRCDAQNNSLYAVYLGKRDYAAAQHELARLVALEPEESRYSWLLAQLSLAKNRGDAAAVSSNIAELRARYPRSYAGAVEQIDQLYAGCLGHGTCAASAQAKPSEALAALTSALHAEPASMATLHRLVPVLGGQHVLAAYRKDGKAAIDAFVKSGHSYDGPQVLVLDYLALRIFDDGSSLQLVQSVTKAQSDEAVNGLAEVEVPEGAQVLTLRAWKPDGTRLEADAIAGKDSVSLPNVATGDFVELEYLQAAAPPDGFPNGYLGDRFYFKSFEVPFDHSHMVVILPKDMPYKVDPRGDAPKLEEKLDGDLRVLTWQVDQSVPLVQEPASVSAREFIPSVKLGVHATYPAMIESLRDALSDRDLYDPYYAALVKQIVGEAAPTDYRARAERLYSWVLENIENNDEVFAQAALMLRAHSGNRARVLHYLLGLAGVPSQLALARNFTGDQTPSDMADADTFDHLLLRIHVPNEKEPIWLFTVERWAPFGFMPSALRGQDALVLDAAATKVQVTQGLLGEDGREFQLAVQLHADGSARIDALETVRGSEAVSWRSQLEQIPGAELERKFEQDYVARLFPGATLVSLQVTGREQDRPELTLKYSVDVTSYGRPLNHGLALPPLLTTELSGNFARTATRKTTELVPAPVRNHLLARITLPAGATLPGLPASSSLRAALSQSPSFTQTHAYKDGTLLVDRSLFLPALRVLPKDYATFADFCRRVDQAEARELFVQLK